MDGKISQKVVCCFCGESLLIEKAVVVIIKPSFESEELQELFCHKEHLLEKIDRSIILHPDFYVE